MIYTLRVCVCVCDSTPHVSLGMYCCSYNLWDILPHTHHFPANPSGSHPTKGSNVPFDFFPPFTTLVMEASFSI